jgi:hypothetical protein
MAHPNETPQDNTSPPQEPAPEGAPNEPPFVNPQLDQVERGRDLSDTEYKRER